MCGIAGFCDFENDMLQTAEAPEQLLKNMHDTLSHRGHDSLGTYLRSHAGLSHARLSIRDIAGGNQPLIRIYRGQEYSICYNGEIYNTDELIPPLKKAGFLFKTSSDTEVILYAFLHYGADFVKRLNGIFAFAIWDERREVLYLYRDRLGVKPLFYYPLKNGLAFASEPKALFCHPEITPKLSVDGLTELLAIGPARTGGCGIFHGMSEVLPGHFLTIGRGSFRDSVYWDLPCQTHTDSYAKTVEKTSFLVRDAVRRQMVSDVPVCTFLSGGIDSSIVTALAYRYMKEQGKNLNTFSFDFVGNDRFFHANSFQPERDLPYVNRMLEHCPTSHTYLECDESHLYDALFDAVDARDCPGMADVDASLLYFCALVKEKNKVALTGECADEIFGGYPWFYREELMNRDGFPWSADMEARTLFLRDDLVSSLHLSEYAHARYTDSLSRAPLLSGESKEEQKRRAIAYLNIKWFMQTLLDRMDRTSMYSGLEARVPFADHRIVEYVFNVPWEMKYKNGVEKTLLRDACSDLLPPELLQRKKSPYPKTYHPGYEQLLVQKMYAILNDKNAPILPLLDRQKVLRFLQSPKEYGRPWYGQLMAGPQLIAYYIQMNYWMEKYRLDLPTGV
jgi:asparagine synthase (glutamine-hydrolysing)